MTATQVVGLLRAREVSPLELLDVLENRIASVDPIVNALPTLCFDRARDHARKLSDNNGKDSLLVGLPVPIKDLTEVSGVKTTFGSSIYKDNISTNSDLMVTHLEHAGGIVYAKTNTPEFGTGGNTYNKVFGETYNPWNLNMSVAGSSGGAAAALATGTAWLAQGSDMGGSLRNPASFCGVVGLRPSVGRVATTRSGQIVDSLSVAGPMARNIEDLALMLDAMCGHEHGDPFSLDAPTDSFLTAARSPVLPDTVAYSVDLGITPVDPQVKRVFLSAIEELQHAGIKTVQTSPDFSDLHEIFHILRAQSYASSFAPLLDKYSDELNPHVIWNIEEGLKLSVMDVAWAEQNRVELISRVQQFFKQYPILLTPATVVPPYPASNATVTECDGVEFENYYQWLSIAYAFTTALCPALSMPCGFTDNGLPVGIQLACKTHGESSLISTAAYFENIFSIEQQTPINPKVL